MEFANDSSQIYFKALDKGFILLFFILLPNASIDGMIILFVIFSDACCLVPV